MSDTKDSKIKKVFDIAYKIYHFVAKVFLYSILIVLIIVALGFLVYFVDLMKNIKSGENKPPILSAYIIISPSMEPAIKVQDAIIIVRKDVDDLKKEDVITFVSSDPRYSGLTITHRIVGVEKSEDGKTFYRTKGDNNNTEDAALVSSDNVYGKVVLKIPKIGYIQYFLTRTYGWLFIVVIPCLGIVIYDIIKLFKSMMNPSTSNNKKEEKIESVDLIGEKEKRVVDTEIVNNQETKIEEIIEDDLIQDDDIDVI